MTMTKRIRIPIAELELALVKAAAARAGLPVAEWARGILRLAARRELGEPDLAPQQALKLLFSTEAPVSDVQTMNEESIRGRLK